VCHCLQAGSSKSQQCVVHAFRPPVRNAQQLTRLVIHDLGPFWLCMCCRTRVLRCRTATSTLCWRPQDADLVLQCDQCSGGLMH
jgi:hypothetical protein